MKYRIEKSDFQSAIATAQKALPSRAASPLLEGILIEANVQLSQLRLVCTDSTLQIETIVPAEVELPGVALLPGKLLGEIVRRLPDGTVEVERPDESAAVVIRCGKSKTSIQTMDASEYPEMPPLPVKGKFTLPQNVLRSMISQTLFATSSDESRPILTGGYLEIKEGMLNVVGLDGYRLAIRSEPCFADGDMDAVVPSGALDAVKQILGDEGDVAVTLSHTGALFDVGHTKLTTVLLSGEYMKYRKIIPTEKLSTVQVNRAELMSAIDRASLMARENKNNLVRFAIGYDSITVSSNSEIGNVVDEVPIHLTGGELEIAFNAKFMTDVLKVLGADELLMEFNTNVTPCVIRPVSGDAWLYLVLPVRIFA